MSDSEDILRKLRALKPALKDWKIKRLRVFGSVLHGTAGPDSDVDLIVDFEEKPSLLGLIRMENEIGDSIGHKIEMVTPEGIDKHLRQKILSEARDVWQ